MATVPVLHGCNLQIHGVCQNRDFLDSVLSPVTSGETNRPVRVRRNAVQLGVLARITPWRCGIWRGRWHFITMGRGYRFCTAGRRRVYVVTSFWRVGKDGYLNLILVEDEWRQLPLVGSVHFVRGRRGRSSPQRMVDSGFRVRVEERRNAGR